MPASTRSLQRDAGNLPVPQYFNPDTDAFEPLLGNDGSQMVNSVRRRFRDDFAGSALLSHWTLTTGTGMTVGVGTVAGALTIDTGTTANQETILQSAFTMTIPTRVQIAFLLSQRIANQEFIFELVDAIDGSNVAKWTFTGTTNTIGAVETLNGGVSSGSTNVTVTATSAVQIVELDAYIDEVYFSNRAINSLANRGSLAVRTDEVPDPARAYYFRVRVRNLATAPASTTRLTIDAISIQDIAELTAEITGGRGSAAASQAIPVIQAVAGPTQPVSGTVTATANAQQAHAANTFTVPTTTANLAASASFTGTGRDMNQVARHRVIVAHTAGNTPGTLIFQESSDNTTFRETRRIPIPSDGMYREYDFAPVLRYSRVVFTNGATTQTFMYLAEKGVNLDGMGGDNLRPNIIPFLETTTALGITATYNGNVIDLGSGNDYIKFRAVTVADQAGTLNIQQSRDGTTWRTTKSVAAGANAVVMLEDAITMRYVRVQYVNGAVAQTTFDLNTALER